MRLVSLKYVAVQDFTRQLEEGIATIIRPDEHPSVRRLGPRHRPQYPAQYLALKTLIIEMLNKQCGSKTVERSEQLFNLLDPYPWPFVELLIHDYFSEHVTPKTISSKFRDNDVAAMLFVFGLKRLLNDSIQQMFVNSKNRPKPHDVVKNVAQCLTDRTFDGLLGWMDPQGDVKTLIGIVVTTIFIRVINPVYVTLDPASARTVQDQTNHAISLWTNENCPKEGKVHSTPSRQMKKSLLQLTAEMGAIVDCSRASSPIG